MVTFLAVLRQVQAADLDLFAGPESKGELDGKGYYSSADDGQQQRDGDGFQLLEHLRLKRGSAPVRNAPKVPPTACTPKVSSASS